MAIYLLRTYDLLAILIYCLFNYTQIDLQGLSSNMSILNYFKTKNSAQNFKIFLENLQSEDIKTRKRTATQSELDTKLVNMSLRHVSKMYLKCI